MNWVLVALIAPVMWGINNILDKFILTKKLRDPNTFNILTMICDLIPLVLIFSFFQISPMSVAAVLSFIGGLLIVPTMLLYNKAMMFEEASRVGSLANIYPIFVSIIAFFVLGESLGFLKYVGIFSTTAGAILISYKKSKNNKKIISFALFLLLIYSFLWGTVSIISKYVLGFIDYWSLYFWSLAGSFVGGVLMLTVPKIGKKFVSDVRKTGRKTLFYIFLTSSVFYIGDLAVVVATSMTSVSLVSAVTATHPLFALLFASLVSFFSPRILKEELGRVTVGLKIVAVCLIFIGIILVTAV